MRLGAFSSIRKHLHRHECMFHNMYGLSLGKGRINGYCNLQRWKIVDFLYEGGEIYIDTL